MFNPNIFPIVVKNGDIPLLIKSESELQDCLQQHTIKIVYQPCLIYTGIATDNLVWFFLDDPNLKVYAFNIDCRSGYLLSHMNCIPIFSMWIKTKTDVRIFKVLDNEACFKLC